MQSGKRDLGRIKCRKVKNVEKDDYSAHCDAAVRHLKVKVSEVEPRACSCCGAIRGRAGLLYLYTQMNL